MVLNLVRSIGAWFAHALDSEGVGIFQGIVYIHVVAAGAYGLVVAGGVPQAVERSMGHVINAVWLWLCVGACVSLAGKSLRKAAAYPSMWLELIGDVFVFGVFAGYVWSTIDTSDWGKALFAVFACAALAECVTLLIIRDVRRIGQVERIVRR